MKEVRERVRDKENVTVNNVKMTECAGIEKPQDKDWKTLYFEMLALKNEADNDLQQMLTLQAENESRMKALLDAHGLPVDSIGTANVKKANEELKKSQEKLQFYELITGMAVESTSDKKFQCTIKHDNQPEDTTFIIGTSADEMTYEVTGNAQALPEYMQNNLSFEKSLTPVILADALHAIFVEEDGEEDDNN